MNRIEFINELEKLLCDIPQEDREDALDYYKDYLDDAGAEQEEKVLEELGSPEKVAKIIKDSLYHKSDAQGEYTETGYRDERYETKQEVGSRENKANQGKQSSGGYKNQKKERNIWKILCIILLIILGWPIILTIVALMFSVIVFIATFIFSLGVAGISVIIAGVFLFGVGILAVIATPAIAMFLCGVGILLSVIGLLFTLLVVKICEGVIPPLIRGFVALCRKPFNRKVAA